MGFVRRSQQVPTLGAAVKSDAFHVSNVLSIGRQLSGEELLGGDLKDPGKLREQSGVRKTDPPFPFGDGAVAQMQQLGQLFLGQPLLQTEGTDQRPGFFRSISIPSFLSYPIFGKKATNAP